MSAVGKAGAERREPPRTGHPGKSQSLRNNMTVTGDQEEWQQQKPPCRGFEKAWERKQGQPIL